MSRITEKDLHEALVELAHALGWPEPEQSHVENSLHLSAAYGGWRVEAYCASGGSRTIGNSGFNPKRQVWEEICNMTAGAHMSRARKVQP